MRWVAAVDEPLVALLRTLPLVAQRPLEDGEQLFARAARHGVAGLLFDALRERDVPLAPGLARRLAGAELARDIDHAAHLALLTRIDGALASAALKAATLKGALLAERVWPRPAARPTTDVDLLVAEEDLAEAARALETLGYTAVDDDDAEARFRAAHHHLHFTHPHALPIELHFHAYRGFGETLRSAPLIARSHVAFVGRQPLSAIRVLAPEDELMYLAVHLAAHRAVRLGWLVDLRLLLERMTPAQITSSAENARASGYARPLALAAALLAEVLGVDRDTLRPLGALGGLRGPLVAGVLEEPANRVLRSATRFIYTAALCGSVGAALRYATSASQGHARLLFARSP